MSIINRNNLCLLLIKQFYPGIIVILLVLFRYISLVQFIVGYLLFCLYHRLTAYNYLYYSEDNPVIKAILDNSPSILHCNYKHPFLLPTNPFQLIFLKTTTVKSQYDIKVTRQKVGDCGIALDWVEYVGVAPDKNKVFVLLPGLTGGTKDTYVMNIVDKALLNKYHVAIYQMRILNESVKLPQDGSHMSLIADFDEAVDAIIEKFGKDVQISAVGYSYGANQLVNYLGVYNSKVKKIKCGVSISCPYEFNLSAKLCEYTIYDRMLVFFLKKAFLRTRAAFEKDKLHIRGDIISTTIKGHQYDKYFTCPIMGYDSPAEYYRAIGCGKNIKHINVPLLIIHSKDDPVTSGKVIPYDDAKRNKNVVLLVTDKGTHSCFLEGNIFNLTQWVNKPTLEFVNANNKII